MPEKKIAKCGHEIFEVPKNLGLYCYEYCCNCCPDAHNSPCQKEKKEGTLIQTLNNF